MRIIAGEFKRRNFYMPQGIRPTQSIIRKVMFDILEPELEREDVCFLDLFAGSGSVGLEAVSRGVSKTVLVERDKRCVEVLAENMQILKIAPKIGEVSLCELIHNDAFIALKLFSRQERKFDLIFIDPPYGRGLAKKALKTLEAHDIVSPNSVIIIEHEKRETLPDRQGRFRIFRQKKFGKTMLDFYCIDEDEE